MEWENRQLSVGIDLHKTQFTVCALAPSGEIVHEEVLKEFYKQFLAEQPPKNRATQSLKII